MNFEYLQVWLIPLTVVVLIVVAARIFFCQYKAKKSLANAATDRGRIEGVAKDAVSAFSKQYSTLVEQAVGAEAVEAYTFSEVKYFPHADLEGGDLLGSIGSLNFQTGNLQAIALYGSALMIIDFDKSRCSVIHDIEKSIVAIEKYEIPRGDTLKWFKSPIALEAYKIRLTMEKEDVELIVYNYRNPYALCRTGFSSIGQYYNDYMKDSSDKYIEQYAVGEYFLSSLSCSSSKCAQVLNR